MKKWILVTVFILFSSCEHNKNQLKITIENHRGSIRSGIDRKGNPWQQKMFHHYGYFNEIMGKDGNNLDFYLNPDNKQYKIFKITQINELTKEFDEHKIMIGFENIQDALEGYLIHYPKNWQGFGKIEEINFEDLIYYESIQTIKNQ